MVPKNLLFPNFPRFDPIIAFTISMHKMMQVLSGIVEYPTIFIIVLYRFSQGRYNSSGVNATTSSMEAASAKSITSRSKPNALPAAGGMRSRSRKNGSAEG